jgi:hypothetical protein
LPGDGSREPIATMTAALDHSPSSELDTPAHRLAFQELVAVHYLGCDIGDLGLATSMMLPDVRFTLAWLPRLLLTAAPFILPADVRALFAAAASGGAPHGRG